MITEKKKKKKDAAPPKLHKSMKDLMNPNK